jgi:beta-glucosidase
VPAHPDARDIVARMTLQEKASLCSGADFWHTQGVERVGVPAITITDGPHGVRLQAGASDKPGIDRAVPATCFPTASALAATWDPGLIAEVGAAIAQECHELGVGVLLGPGVNIKRSPLCGRNFEYFSEDPYLTGEIATAFVRAVQAEGIGTSLKHLAANNQEFRRMTIDAVVDERSLRELELAGFEAVVRQARPWTVMGAYNQLNGTYACEHPWLLTEVLRDEWGFDGIVMTDWGATNDRVEGLRAGCDLEMPGTTGGGDARIHDAVTTDQLDEAVLDVAAERLVSLALTARDQHREGVSFDRSAHHALARRAAADAAVLCHNEQRALPIRDGDTVALIGAFAAEPRFQGTGSSRMVPTRIDDLRTELTALLDGTAPDATAPTAPDATAPDATAPTAPAPPTTPAPPATRVTYAPGYAHPTRTDDALVAEAVAAAQQADVAVVCIGLPDGYENEGADRTHLRLPPTHDALVAAIAAVHERVVVVLSNGAPVVMPWIDDVQAVVEGYLGGQAGGGGLADVLTGVVNPSGHLAETFPRHLDDVAAHNHFPGGPSTVEYREGLYVGYRFHDTVGTPVLFPFGHGLSYTSFAYGEVALDRSESSVEDLAGDAGAVTVSLTVANTGEVAGRAVVQVYVRDLEAAVHRPGRELKAFTKVALEPGASSRVALTLSAGAFSYWHPDRREWTIEPGTFEIRVGASSRDLRSQATLTVTGEPLPVRDEPAVYRNPPVYLDVDAASFEQLLGRPRPLNPPFSRPFTRNTPIGAIADTPMGKSLVWAIEKRKRAGFGDDAANEALVRSMVDDAPLRTLTMDGLTEEQLDGIVDLANGRFGSGGRRVLRQLMTAFDRR